MHELDLQLRFMAVLRALQEQSLSEPFWPPVDVSFYADYTDIIACPTSLDAVTAKAQMGMYANAESFASALALVWHNCRAYNAESSPIHSDAGLLAALSARLVDKWVLSPDRPSDPTTLEWNEPELQPL